MVHFLFFLCVFCFFKDFIHNSYDYIHMIKECFAFYSYCAILLTSKIKYFVIKQKQFCFCTKICIETVAQKPRF